MIQAQTRLKVADNTGAKALSVIKILGGSRHRYATLGDIVIASVKEALPNALAKKKEVVKAVIVRQKNNFRRPDGTYVRFDDNAAVLLNKEGAIRGTRIIGPVAREVGKRGFQKIISLAPEVV